MQNNDKKELKNNTIALITIQILNYILPFITLPYVSRVLTVADYGTVLFAQAFIDYFGRFILFGFDLSAVRQIATKSNSLQKVNQIFNTVLSAQIIFLIIGFIVMNLIIFLVPKFAKDWLIYYYTYFGLIGTVLMFNWFYQGMAKMKFITVLNLICRGLFVILIFVFIRKPSDYFLYPLINSLSMIAAGVISTLFVRKYFNIKYYMPKIKIIFTSIKYSSQFFLTKVAISLYRSTNSFVLGLVVTSTAVAYFVAADKIYWSILALYLTFVNALFPYMSKNKDINFFKKILKIVIALTITAAIIMFIGAKYIILIFYSNKYIESVQLLKMLSFAFSFYFFVDILGFPLLGALGYIKETNSCYIIGGLYNLLGLLILYITSAISIYSITILVVTTYLIMFIHRIYYIKKFKILEEG